MILSSSHAIIVLFLASLTAFELVAFAVNPKSYRSSAKAKQFFNVETSAPHRRERRVHLIQETAFLRTRARKSQRSRNTYDFCESGDICNGDRECIVPGKKKCPRNSDFFCFCLPESFTECSVSSECDAGEICAEDKVDLRPACTSKDAVEALGEFRLNVPPPVPGDGLSYSRCEKDSQCQGDRFCALPTNRNFKPCRGRSPCYCQPNKPSDARCLTQSECAKGEVCANTADYTVPVCVSQNAEKNLFSVSAVPTLKGGGFSFDPCKQDADCIGDRSCTSTATGELMQCKKGEKACICLDTPVLSCETLGNCTKEEVCAETPFFDGSVCTSQFSRRAFGFDQVKFPGICPVLIRNDPPPAARQAILSESADPNLQNEERIVGGRLISPNLAPYLVAIKDKKKRPFCTGTLISKRYVITAAHCEIVPKNFAAVLAENAVKGGVDIRVKEVYTHPKFNASDVNLLYDISILELAEDAPDGAKFMKLNANRRLPKAGSPIRAAGYGDQVEDEGSDYNLRQVDMLTVPFKQCEKAYLEAFVVNRVSKPLQICAGVPRGGCDTCQGDSGGPVFQYIEREPIHMGLSSYGESCGDPDFPGVYARTSALWKWVRDNTPAEFETN